MIETSFFTCPDKGKMLAIYFTEKEELSQDFLSQFINADVDRYIELILTKDGRQILQTILKAELCHPAIIEEVVDAMFGNNELQEVEIE
jgi:hypothetical protein